MLLNRVLKKSTKGKLPALKLKKIPPKVYLLIYLSIYSFHHMEQFFFPIINHSLHECDEASYREANIV